jgi:hypothetical protein
VDESKIQQTTTGTSLSWLILAARFRDMFGSIYPVDESEMQHRTTESGLSRLILAAGFRDMFGSIYFSCMRHG